MKNKLGISDKFILEQVELELVKKKLELLDYNFSFNKDSYDFDFLVELHNYLFGDIYYFVNKDIRNGINDKIKKYVNDLINKLILLSIDYKDSLEEINCVFDKLWETQIFNYGNTRTIFAFFKIYVSAFNLNIDLDINKINIESGKMFK